MLKIILVTGLMIFRQRDGHSRTTRDNLKRNYTQHNIEVPIDHSKHTHDGYLVRFTVTGHCSPATLHAGTLRDRHRVPATRRTTRGSSR